MNAEQIAQELADRFYSHRFGEVEFLRQVTDLLLNEWESSPLSGTCYLEDLADSLVLDKPLTVCQITPEADLVYETQDPGIVQALVARYLCLDL